MHSCLYSGFVRHQRSKPVRHGFRYPLFFAYLNLNRLQGHRSPEPICVTLNPWQAVDRSKVIREIAFRHPVFDRLTVAAQRRRAEINGSCRTYYCGAYWRNGFHEDGVQSALAVTHAFGLGIENCTAACTVDSFAISAASL